MTLGTGLVAVADDQQPRRVGPDAQKTRSGRRHLVQLHPSRQCNRPDLSLGAAQAVIDEIGLAVSIHSAMPFSP